ncbi:MAG: putative T7SS-secreted protein [Thermocrispum sp.]
MTAQLGSTTDPKALIPGEPSAVEADADNLDTHATTLAAVADGLAAVQTPSWSGSASDAFYEAFDPEAANWNQATESFTAAGSDVRDYAGDLRTAQGEADRAIRLWARGDVKTATARAAYTEAVAEMDNSGARRMVGPFFDPGEALRNQAGQVLADAREQLTEDAARLKDALAAESGGGDDTPAWLAAAAASYGDSTEKLLYGTEHDTEFGDYDDTDKSGPSAKATLAELGISVDANLFETGTQGTTELGDLTLRGSTTVSVGAGGDATLSITSGGLEASVEGHVGLKVNAEGEVTIGDFTGRGGVEATAGATGEAQLDIGPDGAQLELEGVVGGQVEGDAALELSGVEAGVEGGVAAGAGGGADVNASWEDGKITIGGKLTAVLGVGGSLGGNVTIDPEEIKDDLGGYLEDQKDGFVRSLQAWAWHR